jgi:mono/diheme cytochrome c family protein
MNNRAPLTFCLLLAIATLFAAACGTARRSEPVAGRLPLEETELVAGRQVFMTHCHQCHPGGEAGLGPALNNKPLPDFLIQLQVRNGFGVMPAFPPEEISAEELDNLLRYMRALRRHEPERRTLD